MKGRDNEAEDECPSYRLFGLRQKSQESTGEKDEKADRGQEPAETENAEAQPEIE